LICRRTSGKFQAQLAVHLGKHCTSIPTTKKKKTCTYINSPAYVCNSSFNNMSTVPFQNRRNKIAIQQQGISRRRVWVQLNFLVHEYHKSIG
jgi:hypothetical protein